VASANRIPASTASALPKVVHVSDPREWQRLCASFLDYNYRHSWYYGMLSADRYRAQIERLAIYSGSHVIGLSEVRMKPVPLLRTGIAYVGGGPLFRRGRNDDLDSLSLSLAALKHNYLNKQNFTLRILPPIQNTKHAAKAVHDRFVEAGFADSPWPPPYRTLMVDLSRPAAEIRKALAQKWRNCLNNSERQKLEIQFGSEPEMFEQFTELFNSFQDRKHISVEQPADFYRDLRQEAKDGVDGFYVCLARHEGKPVAGQIISLLGDAGVSLLGATGEAGLKTKAAYLVQWHVMMEAQKRGLHWFDLGGIDPENNPGVYHFKSGVSENDILSPGPFQAAPASVMASITPALERLYRWTVRRTKSK
jgi:hypothetical protein